uniref:Uncharacterized protein n=1 Tax=Avena sativa TaxID=4498 RepID=A0ACD5XAN1_AVESA
MFGDSPQLTASPIPCVFCQLVITDWLTPTTSRFTVLFSVQELVTDSPQPIVKTLRALPQARVESTTRSGTTDGGIPIGDRVFSSLVSAGRRWRWPLGDGGGLPEIGSSRLGCTRRIDQLSSKVSWSQARKLQERSICILPSPPVCKLALWPAGRPTVLRATCFLEVTMGKGKTIDAFFRKKRDDSEANEQGDPEPITVEPIHVQPPLLLLEFGQQNHEEQVHQIQTNEVIFSGIESLVRDPALRPQMWQYPANQRDDVRRAYLKLGTMQPLLKNYKTYGTGSQKRRFKYNWFSLFPAWLEYSESSHRAYCLFCFLFGRNKNKRGGSDVFTVHGFANWKKVNDGRKCAFLNHIGSEPCSEHNNATKACQDLMNQKSHVAHAVAVGNQRDIERNQLRVKVSIAVVKWLTSQSCAFRGHDETSESKNQGNFLELRKLLAEFNSEIAEVIRDAKYNEQYIAPKIQQEILGIYAYKVRKHIREEIGDSKFSILVDETCDVAKRKQMALVFRFVDKDGILQERFFDLIHVTSTKAATLKELLHLKRPGDTRWGSHLGSISSLKTMFNAVSLVLKKIASDGTAGSIRADGDTTYIYLSSFEFILVLCLMQEILEITEDLGQALQKKSQDIVNAMRLVYSTKVRLNKMRSDDGWEAFFFRVVEFCANHSIDIPDLEAIYILRGGRARRQPDSFTKEHYFRVEKFRATLDTQLHELEFRFSEKVMDLLSTNATLIPTNKFRSFNAANICEMVKKYYPADFSQQEIYGLEQQLKHFIVDVSNDSELKKVSTLTNLCRCLVESGRHSIYNLIDRLLWLLVTLPVSMASAERAFSSLKIIKTRLRNKMEDEFLANSLLVNIEREIAEKYDYEDILLHFTGAKRRRADL